MNITGSQNPVVGKDFFYEILDSSYQFNPDPNAIQYVWRIWKNLHGKWKDITQDDGKTGKRVSYRFGDSAAGFEFRLDVYKAVKNALLGKYEAKKIASLLLVPTPAKEAKINKVVLFNRGAKDPNKAHYSDTLIAQAHCTGMFNQMVEFTLWEDDAPGAGHNPQINKNNALPQKFYGRVNKDGIAETEIHLLSNTSVLKAIANKFVMSGEKSEGKSHEYYVTATYNGKIRGESQVNVNVANPDANKPEQKTQTQTKTKKTPPQKPKENSAIFPGTTHKAQRPVAEKQITHAYFVDNKGNPVNQIKADGVVRIRIKTSGMVGEWLEYVIWEHDTGHERFDDEILRKKLEIKGDMMDTGPIALKKVFELGYKNDFIQEDDKVRQQYYIEVIPVTTTKNSKKFGLDDEAKRMKVENTRTAVSIGKTEGENEKKCPRCEILNMLELNQIFETSSLLERSQLMSAFNEANKKFGLNNCRQKAHFFAQVLQEVGSAITISNGESLNYAVEKLPVHFSKFSKTGRLGGEPNNLAFQYGRIDGKNINYLKSTFKRANLIPQKANEEMIANIAYSNRSDLGNGSIESGDGWKYRGRGIIQITGKEKYDKINKRITADYPEFHIQIDANNINNLKEGTIASMAYWKEYGCKIKADNGVSRKDLDNIVDIVNSKTPTREARWQNLQKMIKIFQLESCTGETAADISPVESVWHEPVDNPISTIYMQSGGGGIGTSGEHWGLFGTTRNGSVHQGLDLFTLPNRNIYACVDGIVEKAQWHSGYGNTITIKVTNKKAFLNHRREYSPLFSNNGEIIQGPLFDKQQDIYLFYAHLQEVLLDVGKIVKAGDIIAKSGVSGVKSGTAAPHLHFEIFTTIYAVGKGLKYRCNPGFYVHFKGANEQSEAEKQLQKLTAAKGKIDDFYGK